MLFYKILVKVLNGFSFYALTGGGTPFNDITSYIME
jgi:hypothetical protein